jgi:hypothetical protein
MSAHPPPVPPKQRSPKGPDTSSAGPFKEDTRQGQQPRDRNLEEQARQGNLSQNTTNKGLQQDR